jgi:hypothetical protein
MDTWNQLVGTQDLLAQHIHSIRALEKGLADRIEVSHQNTSWLRRLAPAS